MNKIKLSNEPAPAILLLAGVAVMLSLPPVRRAIFSAAQLVVRGALEMAHDFQHNKNQSDEKTRQLVSEAGLPYDFSPEFPDEKLERFGRKLKKQSRQVAILTAAGALSIVDRTKPFVDEIQSIIKEAKSKKDIEDAKKARCGNNTEDKSEFEAELAQKFPIHPGI